MNAGPRARVRRIAGRVARRARRALLGLDPFRMEQRVHVLERRIAELERRLGRIDTPERRASERLSRENALAIEHLLHEEVRVRRDLDAERGVD